MLRSLYIYIVSGSSAVMFTNEEVFSLRTLH